MKYFKMIALIVCWLFLLDMTVQAQPARDSMIKAEKGFLNLESHDFDQNEIILLNGEWEFYWEEFLFPEDFLTPSGKQRDSGNTDYIHVPVDWQFHKQDGANPSQRRVCNLSTSDPARERRSGGNEGYLYARGGYRVLVMDQW